MTWLFVLFLIQTVVIQLEIHVWNGMTCDESISRWAFSNCGNYSLVYFLHIFAMMQAAGLVRAVFVKIVKKKNELAAEGGAADGDYYSEIEDSENEGDNNFVAADKEANKIN